MLRLVRIKLVKAWRYVSNGEERIGERGDLFEVDEHTAKELIKDMVAYYYRGLIELGHLNRKRGR